MQAAFDAGIRLFHAAHEREAVSLGASLRTLGLRDRVILSTTDGDALDRCPDTEAGGEAAVMPPPSPANGNCSAWRRLMCSCWPTSAAETHTPRRLAGAMRALDAARAAGTIRLSGVTCYTASDALADAMEQNLLSLDVVFARYNYADQGAAHRLFPLCRARNIAASSLSPLPGSAASPSCAFPNTWRFRNLTQNFYGITAGQAHLHWILRNPGVDGVVVSMQTPEQITENVAAAHLEKTPQGLESLFESFVEAITQTREGWRGLLQDEQWEIRMAAEGYLSRRPAS